MANTSGKLATIGLAGFGLYKKFMNQYRPGQIKDTRITFNGEDTTDMRVRLIVPDIYLVGKTAGLLLKRGIIFPYTPQISYENTAEYSPQNLTHSNYTTYSYKSSRISSINIQAKFTVQTDDDADYYLMVQHLLRALIKMRTGDVLFAGAPPPVCRLKAYGSNMLDEVPVVVGSFRIELPAEVDYYTSNQSTGLQRGSGEFDGGFKRFESANMVPTVSTIQMTLLPMYSRNEMLLYNVDKWLNDDQTLKGRGYL